MFEGGEIRPLLSGTPSRGFSATPSRGFGSSATPSRGFGAQQRTTPAANLDYVNLALSNPYGGIQDERVDYYRKRGIGEDYAVPGAGGYGAGVSHYVYRVPKSELITLNQLQKIRKNEMNAMIAAEAEAKATADALRRTEMNANLASIVYSNTPMAKIDIDLPINLSNLAHNATKLAMDTKLANDKIMKRKQKNGTVMYRNGKTLKFMKNTNYKKLNPPSIDEIVAAAKNAFIQTEKNKIDENIVAKVKKTFPNYFGHNRIYRVKRPQEQITEKNRLIQQHIERKMPKIESVLAKLREGLFMGTITQDNKPVEKKEVNLLTFTGLNNLNFSTVAPTAAAQYYDPFVGLNNSQNIFGRGGQRKTRKLKR